MLSTLWTESPNKLLSYFIVYGSRFVTRTTSVENQFNRYQRRSNNSGLRTLTPFRPSFLYTTEQTLQNVFVLYFSSTSFISRGGPLFYHLTVHTNFRLPFICDRFDSDSRFFYLSTVTLYITSSVLRTRVSRCPVGTVSDTEKVHTSTKMCKHLNRVKVTLKVDEV